MRKVNVKRIKDENEVKEEHYEFCEDEYYEELNNEYYDICENEEYSYFNKKINECNQNEDFYDEYSEENYKELKVNKKNKFVIKPKNRRILVSSKIADLIIKSYSICCINEEVYVYFEEYGYYKCLSKHELRVFIRYCLEENRIDYTRGGDIEDIIYSIKTNPRIQINTQDIKRYRNLVNTLSGVYDIKKKKLLKHDSKYMFFNVIYANFNKENYNENFEKSCFYQFIDDITLGDKELKQRLKEIAGYCLCNANQLRQFYVLLGEGSNGKSVFLNLLSSLIGDENISNIELNYLTDKRYVAELFGKVLNIGSELSDIKLTDTSAIKALVNDTDKISCKPLYKQPFSFTNYCKLIFATNNLPELNNKNYKNNTAFFNRAVIVPFNNVIPLKKQDKNLIKKLKKERDIVLNWALEGLEQIRENDWNLSYCKISEECSNQYRDSQSSIERFIDEKLYISGSGGDYLFKSDIKEALNKFYIEEDISRDGGDGVKYLHNLLVEKYKITYKKIRIGDKTRYGYIGIVIL
ncbi:MAG: phage/plasmid primase, P4 family [Clostridium sp.]|uniref:DNA primase family protein n=1 Tax=Clostridium sp. TaxID=1506 RepID=UPI00290004E9|nr:phage/plasmid primase, P4 family [Clostridium sp.]MDU1936419.1 phage/plasmid primase, P4 family [Clostridium sp.]MDU2045054.1 phage/plasmid primase, P4 family [Clostridium sp.]